MAITTMKLFGSFGSFRACKNVPCLSCIRTLPHSTKQPRSSRLPYCKSRAEYSVRRKSMHSRLTSVAQVCCSFIILKMSVNMSWLFPDPILTCLLAVGSFGTPQPFLKQFASSKIASTSSPFAAPPFFIPAWSASSSIEAAFDAAADRYVTADSGFGVHPQPWLMK